MAEREWTSEQLSVITSRGKLLVNASAGSGKTAVMVERVVKTVLDGTDIERILVVTFTVAAAREMKDRIATALSDACVNGADERLKEQIDKLPLAAIGTIDSFCSQVAKRYSEYAGVDPSFSIIGEDEKDVLIKESFDELFDAYSKRTDEDYYRILDRYSIKRSQKPLKEIISGFYDFLCVLPDRDEWIRNNSKYLYEHTDEIKAQVFGELKTKCAELLSVCVENHYLEISRQKAVAEIIDALTACVNANNFEELSHITSVLRFSRLNFSKDTDAFMKDEIKNFKEHVGDILIKDTDSVLNRSNLALAMTKERAEDGKRDIDVLMKITLEYAEIFENKKLKNNLLEFSDVARVAYRALENKEVASELSSEYDYVFVDEYQDVNKLQESIFKLLERNGNLFMVGDPKQSIYGFRHADPTIFTDTIKDKSVNNKNMTANFRTDAKILDFVNKLFGNIMTEKSAGIDYSRGSMMTGLEYPIVNDVAPVTVVDVLVDKSVKEEKMLGVYSVKEDKRTANEREQASGIYVAHKIAELIGKPVCTGFDADKKPIVKPIGYGDIAVLARKGKLVFDIHKVLHSYGIPTHVEYKEEACIAENELNAMLTVVDNSRRDIPLILAMKSFFDFTDEELFDIVNGKTCENFFECVLNDKEVVSEKHGNFLRSLDEYKKLSKYYDVHELALHIIADRDYFNKVNARDREEGVRFERYVDKLFQMKSKESLSTYVKKLDEAESEETDVEYGNKEKSVSVMTIHKSKGLEYPIVFLVGANDGFIFDNEKKETMFDKKEGIALHTFDDVERIKETNFIRKYHLEKSKDNERCEEMRLLYVALTRAKSHLFIVAQRNAINGAPIKDYGADTYINYISGRDSDGKIFYGAKYEKFDVTDDSEGDAQAPEKRMRLLSGDKEAVKRAASLISKEYVHDAATRTKFKYTVSEINELLHPIDSANRSDKAEDDELGSLYHKVFQYIDFSATTREKVEAEITRLIDEKVMDKERAVLLDIDKICNVLNSDLIRYASINGILREQKFMLSVPAKELAVGDTEDEVLVQGTIDLLITGEKTVLVDYKLSSRSADALKATYGTQMKIYKRAAETVLKKPVDEVFIMSINNAEAIKIVF